MRTCYAIQHKKGGPAGIPWDGGTSVWDGGTSVWS